MLPETASQNGPVPDKETVLAPRSCGEPHARIVSADQIGMLKHSDPPMRRSADPDTLVIDTRNLPYVRLRGDCRLATAGSGHTFLLRLSESLLNVRKTEDRRTRETNMICLWLIFPILGGIATCVRWWMLDRPLCLGPARIAMFRARRVVVTLGQPCATCTYVEPRNASPTPS